jgi:hypothetical protein
MTSNIVSIVPEPYNYNLKYDAERCTDPDPEAIERYKIPGIELFTISPEVLDHTVQSF